MKLLALTMGEPGGIGPELALSAWRLSQNQRDYRFAVYADINLMQKRAQLSGINVPVLQSTLASAADNFSNGLPVIPLETAVRDDVGNASPHNAAAVIEAIIKAVEAVQTGKASAVVTNPIHKTSLRQAGFEWPGHTEFLEELSFRHNGIKSRAVMMLASDELKVVPVTIHIPLKDVPQSLTFGNITETIEVAHLALQEKFKIISPRLVVTGLNPHAGENGTMGREDIDIIAPAVSALNTRGYRIHGPLPADTLFHPRARETYDAVIAMYHDQALLPIKTIAFDSAVNITLGLPFIRTSPDHGTALDIAGTGKARPDSLLAALKMAAQLS